MNDESTKSHRQQSSMLGVFDRLRKSDSTPPNNPRIKDWVRQLPPPTYSIYEDSQQPTLAHHGCELPANPALSRKYLAVASPNPQRRPHINTSSKRKAEAPLESVQPRRSARLRTTASHQTTQSQLSQSNVKVMGDPEEPYRDADRPGVVTRGRYKTATQTPHTPLQSTRKSIFDNFELFPRPDEAQAKISSPSHKPRNGSTKKSSTAPSGSPTRSSTTGTSLGKALVSIEHFAKMSPQVLFFTYQTSKQRGPLPNLVQSLWEEHIVPAQHEKRVIPKSLRQQINTALNTPSKSQQIKDVDFGECYHKDDLSLLLNTVNEVYENADTYRDTMVHECHWVTSIITPLMHQLQRLQQFKPKGKLSRIETLHISTVEISPHSLCPVSPDAIFKDVDKRIDYAVAIRLTPEQYDDIRVRYVSINQTSSTMTCYKPVFIHIEVKGPLDDRDPLIQMGAWCAAEFEKRSQVGFPFDMPVIAIVVVQDVWKLYIAYATQLPKGNLVQNRDYIVKFMGPTIIGDTTCIQGIFHLFFILVQLTKWGLTVYQPWFEKNVLKQGK